MTEKLKMAVLDTSRSMADCDSDTSIIGPERGSRTWAIELEFNVLGKSLNFCIAVTDRQAVLADIVPLARIISTKITEAVVESLSRQGGGVSCRKGCIACCSRYLVPLSIPEALQLRREIMSAPAPQRETMLRACISAAQRVLNERPPTSFSSRTTASPPESSAFLDMVSSWYVGLEVPCPFLSTEGCTIYEKRPLACREHFITGSPKACGGSRSKAEVVKIPVRMVEALGLLASELENTEVEAVIMPLAVVWGNENLRRCHHSWPERIMVEKFVEIVKTMASQNSAAAAG